MLHLPVESLHPEAKDLPRDEAHRLETQGLAVRMRPARSALRAVPPLCKSKLKNKVSPLLFPSFLARYNEPLLREAPHLGHKHEAPEDQEASRGGEPHLHQRSPGASGQRARASHMRSSQSAEHALALRSRELRHAVGWHRRYAPTATAGAAQSTPGPSRRKCSAGQGSMHSFSSPYGDSRKARPNS